MTMWVCTLLLSKYRNDLGVCSPGEVTRRRLNSKELLAFSIHRETTGLVLCLRSSARKLSKFDFKSLRVRLVPLSSRQGLSIFNFESRKQNVPKS